MERAAIFRSRADGRKVERPRQCQKGDRWRPCADEPGQRVNSIVEREQIGKEPLRQATARMGERHTRAQMAERRQLIPLPHISSQCEGCRSRLERRSQPGLMEFENIIRYRPMEPAKAGFATGACGFSCRAGERIAGSFFKNHQPAARRRFLTLRTALAPFTAPTARRSGSPAPVARRSAAGRRGSAAHRRSALRTRDSRRAPLRATAPAGRDSHRWRTTWPTWRRDGAE